MAIKVLKRGAGYGKNCITEFLVDTEADVANLPTNESVGTVGKMCAPGSTALIAETKAIVILNNQGAWV